MRSSASLVAALAPLGAGAARAAGWPLYGHGHGHCDQLPCSIACVVLATRAGPGPPSAAGLPLLAPLSEPAHLSSPVVRPLPLSASRDGATAPPLQWRRRQKNRETPVRPPPAGGLVCRRSTSTRRAPPCVLPRASARDALRLLFDRFRSVARASHTGRAMLRTRGCDPPRPASAGPPRTLREPSATTPPRDAQRLRVSSRATAPLVCFRTRFPPPLMAARRPAPSGGIVHRSCDAAARGRAPTVSHRCSLRACAASFLTAWRPPRPTQGVPAAQQEPTPSGWSVRAARRRRNHRLGGSRLPKPKPTFRRPPHRKSFTIAFVQIKGGPSHLSWTETRENEFHPKKPLHLTRVGGWTGGRARAGVGEYSHPRRRTTARRAALPGPPRACFHAFCTLSSCTQECNGMQSTLLP